MTTPAFLLRPRRPEDVVPYGAFLADAEVTIWLEERCQRPLTLAEVQSFVLDPAWCRWSIECEGAFVGMTGLEDYDATRCRARFFIVIGERTLWGRGLGRGVMRQVVHHGFHHLGLRKIVSDFLAPNHASRRLHEEAGFRVEGQARRECWRRGEWVDRIHVALFREDADRGTV
ncbi:MAG: GNAT family N-acetyltransferase [Magnetococcales bacterium]|nr:GNAT family N-acetyltransferase [Magnetococcales bacterium]